MNFFATSIVATFISVHNSLGVFSSSNLARSSNLFESSEKSLRKWNFFQPCKVWFLILEKRYIYISENFTILHFHFCSNIYSLYAHIWTSFGYSHVMLSFMQTFMLTFMFHYSFIYFMNEGKHIAIQFFAVT